MAYLSQVGCPQAEPESDKGGLVFAQTADRARQPATVQASGAAKLHGPVVAVDQGGQLLPIVSGHTEGAVGVEKQALR